MKMGDIEAERAGDPSAFSCPECQGVLWELKEGDPVRFRCRVGHAYSSESLLAAKSEELEAALWSALRALEESAAFSRRMAERAKKNGYKLTHSRLSEHASEQQEQATLVRNMLVRNGRPTTPTQEDAERTGTEG